MFSYKRPIIDNLLSVFLHDTSIGVYLAIYNGLGLAFGSVCSISGKIPP